MSESALNTAAYFLSRGAEENVPISPMKLLKLVYLAHGWHLGFLQKPLIWDEVEAWPYGPVIPILYHETKEYRNAPISDKNIFGGDDSKRDQESKRILDAVWEGYKNFAAVRLSAITHADGSPWHQVWNEMGGSTNRGTIIPDSLIQKYYQEQAKHHVSAAA